jgi:hypothetical protein
MRGYLPIYVFRNLVQYCSLLTDSYPETTQIWGKEFPGSVLLHEAWELLFFYYLQPAWCFAFLTSRRLPRPIFEVKRR